MHITNSIIDRAASLYTARQQTTFSQGMGARLYRMTIVCLFVACAKTGFIVIA
jgi:hypothetical protein